MRPPPEFCFALALWNGVDPILKERMFGLTGPEGNHGEDVKEYWWYLDSTPTHAWMRWRYHYPQRAFPYDDWCARTRAAAGVEPEYELIDTGVFDEDRYWIVEVDHAKAGPNDMCIRIRVTNAGPDAATLHVLPTLWFRNTWSWGLRRRAAAILRTTDDPGRLDAGARDARPPDADRRRPARTAAADWLVCDNETNAAAPVGRAGRPGAPEGRHQRPRGRTAPDAVQPDGVGTKAAAWYQLTRRARRDHRAARPARRRPGRDSARDAEPLGADDPLGAGFDRSWPRASARPTSSSPTLTPTARPPTRRASCARPSPGMMWGKQFYHFDVGRWLDGDPASPPPPTER